MFCITFNKLANNEEHPVFIYDLKACSQFFTKETLQLGNVNPGLIMRKLKTLILLESHG